MIRELFGAVFHTNKFRTTRDLLKKGKLTKEEIESLCKELEEGIADLNSLNRGVSFLSESIKNFSTTLPKTIRMVRTGTTPVQALQNLKALERGSKEIMNLANVVVKESKDLAA